MDEYLYLKFRTPSLDRTQVDPDQLQKRRGLMMNILEKLLGSNPKYGKLIDFVETWKIEYNLSQDAAWREVGLDNKGTSILAMPFNGDYGYWTDNNLTIEDFKENFGAEIISKSEFEDDWNNFTL